MKITLSQPNMMDMIYLCSHARPDEKEQWEAISGTEWDIDTVAINLFNRGGMKWVLLDGDRPFCVGGFEPVVNEVWESWMVGTVDDWVKYWRSITKYSRRIMDDLLKHEARRLQTFVLSSRAKTCEWYVRGLKMEREGTMRGFCANGEDMDVYARIRE